MRKCLREKCQKEFEPKRPKSKFCSSACRVYHHRETRGSAPKEKPTLNVDMEKLAELIATKMATIKSAEVKKVDGKPVGIFEMEVEEPAGALSYNEYLEVIAKAKSIEECVALDFEVKASDFANWQKAELSKNIKLRSQHPDLN